MSRTCRSALSDGSGATGGGRRNTTKPFAGHGSTSTGRHPYMPRSQADLTGLTRVLSTDTAEHGSWCYRRLVAHRTTSVLSQFSDIKLATAPTHLEIFDEMASTAAGRQEPYTCVSSAYVRWQTMAFNHWDQVCSVHNEQHGAQDWPLWHSTHKRDDGWL